MENEKFVELITEKTSENIIIENININDIIEVYCDNYQTLSKIFFNKFI
jgi:hypothetical protein